MDRMGAKFSHFWVMARIVLEWLFLIHKRKSDFSFARFYTGIQIVRAWALHQHFEHVLDMSEHVYLRQSTYQRS